MDIIHESGKAYDLGDIQLTLSRMNPFFNDYGEQSLPVTLPPTDRNYSSIRITWPGSARPRSGSTP